MIIRWSSLKTFFRAILRTLRYAKAGFPVIAPKEIQAERFHLCRECRWHIGNQCVLCTCFIGVKTLLSAESCPDHPPRWKKLTFSGKPPKDLNPA